MAADAGSRERDLIRRLRGGDRRPLADLMDLHGEAMMQYLVSILRSRDAAEDAFQDTWVRVVERIHNFDPDRPFAPWLFRVARNRAYDQQRRRRRWVLLPLSRSGHEAGSDCASDGGALADRVADRDLTRKLLDGLDPVHRELIWLRFDRGSSYEEIANLCGLRLGTVKSRLRRALDRLGVLYESMEDKG